MDRLKGESLAAAAVREEGGDRTRGELRQGHRQLGASGHGPHRPASTIARGRSSKAVCNRIACLGRRAVPAHSHIRLAEVEPGPAGVNLEHGFWQPRRDVELLAPSHRLDQVGPAAIRQRECGEGLGDDITSDHPADHVRSGPSPGLADLPRPPHVSRRTFPARCPATTRTWSMNCSPAEPLTLSGSRSTFTSSWP